MVAEATVVGATDTAAAIAAVIVVVAVDTVTAATIAEVVVDFVTAAVIVEVADSADEAVAEDFADVALTATRFTRPPVAITSACQSQWLIHRELTSTRNTALKDVPSSCWPTFIVSQAPI